MAGREPAEADASTTATSAAAVSPAEPRPRDHSRRSGDAEAAEAIDDAEYGLRFELVYAEFYHADRAAFLKRVTKAGSLITALSGTAVVGSALGAAPILAAISGGVVTLVGTTETVLDLAGLARRHEARVERIRALQAELACCERTTKAIATIEARRLELDQIEPASYHAAAALAWNAAYLRLSENPDSRSLLTVPSRARFFRNVRCYAPEDFRSPDEAERERQAAESRRA